MGKSLVLDLNTKVEDVVSLAAIGGCSVVEWPIKHLGLPLGGNPIRSSFWVLVISKVNKRLNGWKRAFLLHGGRLPLITSVLSSLPIFSIDL